MRNLGITIYPDFYTEKEIEEYIQNAKRNSFNRIFTCLQLNDFGFDGTLSSTSPIFKKVFDLAHKLDMVVSVDANKEVFESYSASPINLLPFRNLGIDILRIDGGFNVDEIIQMTNNPYNIKIEINASFISSYNDKLKEDSYLLLENIKNNGTIDNFLACFNFYPRIGTGQSLDMLKDSISILKKYDIKLGAFVASQYSKHDLFSNGHGIMTLEHQRYTKPWIAMQELFAIEIDTILIGDSMAADTELELMGKFKDNDYITLPVLFNEYIPKELKEQILQTTFVVREDQPEFYIRSQTLRKVKVSPMFCVPRKKYSITIDNELNFRYEGELQICLCDNDRDSGVNVIGAVCDDGICLLEYLKFGNNKFRLKE